MKRKSFIVLGVLAVPVFILSVIYHDSKLLFHIGTAVLLMAAIVINAFVILYWRRNWKANPYGRALMYSKISLALLADLSVVTLLVGPDWSGRGVVRLFLYGGIFISQSRLLWLLFTVKGKNVQLEYEQRQKIKEDKDA